MELSNNNSTATLISNEIVCEDVDQGTGSVQPQTRLHCYVITASIVAAIGGILFGYDIGIVAGALLLLRRRDVFGLECQEQEFVVSSMLLGAVFGAGIGGYLIDRFGRKMMIYANSFVFIAGGLILATAPSFSVLIVGRVCIGIAVSISAIADCVYISEIAPFRYRGTLVSLNELGITFGFLLAYLVNFVFVQYHSGWRFMFGLSIIPCLIQNVALCFLPESPRYLVLRDKFDHAERVLKELYKTQDIQQELKAIKTSVQLQKKRSALDLCRTGQNGLQWRLFIAMGLVFFQQISGQPTILLYAPLIFGSLGFVSSSAQTLATIGLGIAKMCATTVSVLLLDRLGRRFFLMTGSAIMSLSAFVVGILTLTSVDQGLPPTCVDTNSSISPDVSNSTIAVPNTVKYLSLISVIIFVMAYALSFAAGSWVIMSEIFPAPLRGRAMSVATVLNWVLNGILSLVMLNVINAIKLPWTFIAFSIVCLIATTFIWLVVPETKNRSLEQISSDLQTRLRIPRCLSTCLNAYSFPPSQNSGRNGPYKPLSQIETVHTECNMTNRLLDAHSSITL